MNETFKVFLLGIVVGIAVIIYGWFKAAKASNLAMSSMQPIPVLGVMVLIAYLGLIYYFQAYESPMSQGELLIYLLALPAFTLGMIHWSDIKKLFGRVDTITQTPTPPIEAPPPPDNRSTEEKVEELLRKHKR